MKTRNLLCLATTLVVLAGCVPSLSPFFDEDDLVFKPALLGVWADDDGEETWTFSAHDPRSYRLVTVDDDGKRGEFEAHLAEVGGRLFLDLFPEDPGEEMSDFYKIHLVPAHTFFLVEQIEPSLAIRFMDQRWLSELLEKDPEAVSHRMIDDVVVLTASTKDLQDFVLSHVETPGAFDDPAEMTRIQE